MSIIEIMIAAVILFIILTGVLGLVGTTTIMGVDAKQRNVMVNALNAYVEKVQSLPFDSVELTTDGGALASVETTTVGEFTVTIQPTVADGTNDALKSITIVVSVSAPGRETSSYTTTVPIRDRSQFLTQANRSPETDPTIEFNDAFMPEEGAVVWGTSCTGGTGVLKLAVDATASDGRLINNVALWIDDTYFAKNTLGEYATWNPASQTFSNSTFVWNTLQTEDVIQTDGSYLAVPIIADGIRTVSAYVLDDMGVSVYTVRHLLVDNYRPGMPGVPTSSVASNTAANLAWTAASDGTTPANSYQLRVLKQPSTDTLTTNPSERWTQVTTSTATSTSFAFTGGTSFSRYYSEVRAVSPRGLVSDYTTGTPVFVTRPLITGTYVITRVKVSGKYTYTKTSTLTCTAPTFPTSSITYTWYRDGVQVGTGQTLSANAATESGLGVNDPCSLVSYYCIATYAPQGFGGGTSATIKSNTVKTTSTGVVASTAYGVGTW